jgi:hypothetical protein
MMTVENTQMGENNAPFSDCILQMAELEVNNKSINQMISLY